MGKNILEYKGYVTKVYYDATLQKLYGKVEGIVDPVTFECDTCADVENAFHDAVDHYLEFCERAGRRPCKAYKGQFNIRIEPNMHKALPLIASNTDESLNTVIERALSNFLAKADKPPKSDADEE